MTVSLLIGTAKGAFVLDGGADRSGWTLTGPHCDGWYINHVIGDPATGALWAGGGSAWSGAGVWRSTDGGESWTLAKLSQGEFDAWAAADEGMAKMFGWSHTETEFDGQVEAIWSLEYAHGALYAGGKPGALLVSHDGGAGWQTVDGLMQHESRDSWEPGGAGLVTHTILSDERDKAKLWVAISAAGVFASEDGGATWERRNRMSNEEACAEHQHPGGPSGGEIGFCVHNMVRAAAAPGDLIYQQNHHGVYRSPDGGRHWDDVTANLPSHFGFPIRVHPRDPQTVWTLPLNGDIEGRYPPDARAAVWKTTDGGANWSAKRDGLPGENCFFTVLRQAMSGDRQDSAGIYFGTNTGSVFASCDEGETWEEIARHLPCILSVEALDCVEA